MLHPIKVTHQHLRSHFCPHGAGSFLFLPLLPFLTQFPFSFSLEKPSFPACSSSFTWEEIFLWVFMAPSVVQRWCPRVRTQAAAVAVDLGGGSVASCWKWSNSTAFLAETHSVIKSSEYLPALLQRTAPESRAAVTGAQVRSFQTMQISYLLLLSSNKRTGTIFVHLEILWKRNASL